MSLEPRDLIGLSGTYLGDLGFETLTMMLEGARLHDVRRHKSLFPTGSVLRTGALIEGTARSYLGSPGGVQLTLRYQRPGSLVSSASSRAGGAAVPIRFEAVTDCTLIEFDLARVQALRSTRPNINAAATEELLRRLEDVYRSYAATTQGTLRERLAMHLLESAEARLPGPLFAPATQRELADALGTRREVVTRALADMARDGLIETSRGGVRLVAPARLIAAAGRWWNPTRLTPVDASAGAMTTFDDWPSPVVGIDMQGEVVYANPQVSPTFGWSVEEMIGIPITRLLPPEVVNLFRQMFGSYMTDVQAGPIGLGARFHGSRADGSQFPAEITILPARAPAGVVVFAVVTDVTYRQALRTYLTPRQAHAAGAGEPKLNPSVDSAGQDLRDRRSSSPSPPRPAHPR